MAVMVGRDGAGDDFVAGHGVLILGFVYVGDRQVMIVFRKKIGRAHV